MEWMKMFCRYDIEGFNSLNVAIAECELTNIRHKAGFQIHTHEHTHTHT